MKLRRPVLFGITLCFAFTGSIPAQTVSADDAAASELDRHIIALAKKDSQILANLTYLCDVIGSRLTGSANLKRANEWAAAKMQEYGLSSVHHEPWLMPEGWERGPVHARLLEPNNGHSLSLASFAWRPGTNGKIQADVIAFNPATLQELASFKGKLKGAIVLTSPPMHLPPLEEIAKQENMVFGPSVFGRGLQPRGAQKKMQDIGKEKGELLQKEPPAAVLLDANKHFGLLFTSGGWQGKDRPSALSKVPLLSVAHNHYEMLYRLATRPAPARTRMELQVENKFIPGPLAIHNTIGEIRGAEKPDEFVIIGGHLDSWDLGQGTTDNGTGSATVLEAARILSRCGVRPRRTIRFVLFTGEEQGLHGSTEYVKQHKAEMPRVSACLVHDSGTGKVLGIGAGRTPSLIPLLQKELACLKDLGVSEFTGTMGGSDHLPFQTAGVPGFYCMQQVAGYRFTHHSQADTLDRAIEANLIQGAQVVAVTAMRLANRDKLLPRAAKTKAKTATRRFTLDDLGRIVRPADPQISPDGNSIALVVSRPNHDKNRWDSELVLVDIASGKQRILTWERNGVSQPRWSPRGDRLAFLASSGSGPQVHVMPMNGGDARRITNAPKGIQHYAWKPDGSAIAFATADEPANKKDIEKHLDAFEVGNNDYLANATPTSTHIWLVPADGGPARRLTSGPWSLTTIPPPGPPSAPLSWSPDGKSIAFVRQERPHDGDNDRTIVQILDVAAGKTRSLTGRTSLESFPSFSPDGSQIVYWYPREADPNHLNEVWVAPAMGGQGRCLTRDIDRSMYQSLWFPDNKSILVGGNDGTRVSMWVQPLDGPARRLDLGTISPTWAYRMDANMSKTGAIAFTGSDPGHPTELFYMTSAAAKPRRLTNFNKEVAGLHLGNVESLTWKGPDGFTENGILVYPPEFSAGRKYPLVLLIHGGPQSASTQVFSPMAQLIAAHGYLVFSPNYRGSDNLGHAYQKAIVRDWGDGPGRDVMAGLEALKKRGFVDEGRIAVTGWSYGGYMTAWLIGHYQCWKTAIAGAAVTDWCDHYDLADGNVQHRYMFGGSRWNAPFEQLYRSQSPITYARNIRTPTLIMATTGDARVPITQSYRLYHCLKDNGVPVRFVAYPVAGHFPGDPVRQKDLFRRWVAWLDEKMR